MHNLLELFSTDRTLLNHRGSLIIRQLCVNLNTERIYKTLAEILEKEEVRLAIATLEMTSMCNVAAGLGIREWNGPEVEYYSYHLAWAGWFQTTAEKSGDSGNFSVFQLEY